MFFRVGAGLRNRAIGSNTVNEHSSRSHSVLTLNIDSEIYDEEDDKLCMTRHGKLAFVDLAGTRRSQLNHRHNYDKTCNKSCNTCTRLADLISIILCMRMRNIMLMRSARLVPQCQSNDICKQPRASC